MITSPPDAQPVVTGGKVLRDVWEAILEPKPIELNTHKRETWDGLSCFFVIATNLHDYNAN